MNNAKSIASALNKNLSSQTEIIVFGSSALLLDPKFVGAVEHRVTNDIDLIVPDDREVEVDSDRQFWLAIEKTNKELEPSGLYLTHIMPEREVVLSEDWKEHLVQMPEPQWPNLKLLRPRMLDLILSKMGRGDSKDLVDIQTMLSLEEVHYDDVYHAARFAKVPEIYAEIFPAAKARVLNAVRLHHYLKDGGKVHDYIPEETEFEPPS